MPIPSLHRSVWILAAGRLLSQIGTGFTLFYMPIFFVNEVGLTATLVGIGLGSGQVAGILGRFLGGTFADSPSWGRRRTLLLSAAISALADVFLTLTYNFPMLLVGNLVMGLGVGLYWPATEAAVADLTTPQQRNEAFAITRLADSIGLNVGVILGGVLISTTGNYRALFMIDGVSFLVFFAVIYFAIAETYSFKTQRDRPSMREGWTVALRDRCLLVYLPVNALFTIFVAQTQSTLPLYFRNHIPAAGTGSGFSPEIISRLFAWHIIAATLLQLPIVRLLNRFTRARVLMFSLLLWASGFICVWMTGVTSELPIAWATVALTVLALALVSFTPSASALIAELAPESLRGVYLSIGSQCWAFGYLVGPPLGGWALDQTRAIANGFWLTAAASTAFGVLMLRYLDRLMVTRQPISE